MVITLRTDLSKHCLWCVSLSNLSALHCLAVRHLCYGSIQKPPSFTLPQCYLARRLKCTDPLGTTADPFATIKKPFLFMAHTLTFKLVKLVLFIYISAQNIISLVELMLSICGFAHSSVAISNVSGLKPTPDLATQISLLAGVNKGSGLRSLISLLLREV